MRTMSKRKKIDSGRPWLLGTPVGGTVLDVFAGSGSTLKAALLEGFDCIGIEREEEYVAIAKARCEHVLETDHPLLRQVNE